MDEKQQRYARESSEAEVASIEAPPPSTDSSQQPAGVETGQAMQQDESVALEYRHSLGTRWMHWINFPLLFLMIYSGILIYWADSQHEGLHSHEVYRVGVGGWTLFRFFPRWFYNDFHLKFQLAQGLAYHFFFMWFFALNGAAYVTYTLLSGEWRNLVPTKESFRGAINVALHDLGLGQHPLPELKFNHAQRIAYTGVVLMGAGSLLTGLAIYKPTQLHLLTSLFGGYEMARWFHFWLTVSYVGFFVVHLIQVVRSGWNNFRAMIIGYRVVSARPEQKEYSGEQDSHRR
jgi:thiosulfate reductase cytochrome b subunit